MVHMVNLNSIFTIETVCRKRERSLLEGQKRTDGAPFSIKEHLEKVEEYLNRDHSEVLRRPKEEKLPIEIAFAISLKSKTVSRDWNVVQANLAKTLRSILSNTDQNLRILIAGHEKPEIEELQHDRVAWLPVDFPPPVDSNRFSYDKLLKRLVIGAYLKKKGFSGYFMPIDADDWIHYRFVEFIRSRPFSDAFIVKKGFMANLVREEIWVRDHFYNGCGSSAVVYFSNSDFSLSTKMRIVQGTSFGVVLKPHMRIAQHLEEMNKKYTMIDVPLVSWVIGNGENLTLLLGKLNQGISAKSYAANGEKFEEWFYDYFKIRTV
jgi:hypothetical protein